MYEYLEGTLLSILTDAAILDIGGIGYHIHISKTCPSRCLPSGQKLKLYVDLVVREDAHTLYGFATPRDRDFFRLLQQVNGIGPKVALNILSHAPAEELAAILFRRDTKSLSSIPGIGKKLAERLVVELNERIGDFVTSSSTPSLSQDAIRALQTLGFSSSEARHAISTAQKDSPALSSVEQIVQYALSTKR
jgi:Holliday junction DNA helicase RuvA